MAGSLAGVWLVVGGGWSLAPASPDASGGVAIFEKRMAGSLADDWLMTG